MSRTLVFSNQEDRRLAAGFAETAGLRQGELEQRRFPDGETYLRVHGDCTDIDVIVVARLDRPDEKTLPALLLADTLRDLGARRVGLVAPYFPYLRQDDRFRDGEGITSRYYSQLLANHVDWLATVDPHLHRLADLATVFPKPARVLSADVVMAEWITNSVPQPLLIGPDEESGPWVRRIAEQVGAPHLVLRKVRHGDREVEVAVPDVAQWQGFTPVLLDDIISTGRTMAAAVSQLREQGLHHPVCAAVHGVFAGDAVSTLKQVGVDRIVTSNSIAHHTNAVDLAGLLASAYEDFARSQG